MDVRAWIPATYIRCLTYEKSYTMLLILLKGEMEDGKVTSRKKA